jgi:(E)-4-hydroxy-3-methylbut-2-enyl-diphosphate synthase
MVYMAGKIDHKIENDQMVDHIAGLVEAKAAQMEAEKKAALAVDPILEAVAAG